MIESTDNKITHPMGDRVRSALFAKIFSRKDLVGSRVLDVFAGTGAVGLEALSRGASYVEFIERDANAISVLERNVRTLGVSADIKIAKLSTKSWLSKWVESQTREFDLIIADPPYDKFRENWPEIERIFENACAKNGLMILSCRSGETLPNPKGVVVVDKSSYGEASLVFYRKIEN